MTTQLEREILRKDWPREFSHTLNLKTRHARFSLRVKRFPTTTTLFSVSFKFQTLLTLEKYNRSRKSRQWFGSYRSKLNLLNYRRSKTCSQRIKIFDRVAGKKANCPSASLSIEGVSSRTTVDSRPDNASWHSNSRFMAARVTCRVQLLQRETMIDRRQQLSRFCAVFSISTIDYRSFQLVHLRIHPDKRSVGVWQLSVSRRFWWTTKRTERREREKGERERGSLCTRLKLAARSTWRFRVPTVISWRARWSAGLPCRGQLDQIKREPRFAWLLPGQLAFACNFAHRNAEFGSVSSFLSFL